MTVKLTSLREPYRHMYQGTLSAAPDDDTNKSVELPFQFSDMSGRFTLGEGEGDIGWTGLREISDLGLELVLSSIIDDSTF